MTTSTATFNRATGAMWLTDSNGRVTRLGDAVHDVSTASAVLAQLGAVRVSDWGLVVDRAPMRQAQIKLP